MKNNLITKIKQFNYDYLAIVLGLLIILGIMWIRFFRPRLPKDVPFDLNLFMMLALVCTCVAFIYVIKRLLNPITNSALIETFRPLNIYIIQIFSKLKTFITYNRYFEMVLYYSVVNLRLLIASSIYNHVQYQIYYLWYFGPRILLLTLFYLDVLYFHKLDLMYSFIFLGIISPLITYWYNSLEYLQEKYIQWLDQHYEVNLLESEDGRSEIHKSHYDGAEGYFTMKGYLNCVFIFDKDLTYDCVLKWTFIHTIYPDFYGSKDWLTKEQRDYLEKDFYEYFPLICTLEDFKDSYSFVIKYDKDSIKLLNILIYLSYLLLWLYILIISLPNFHITEMEWIFMQSFQDINNPFSSIQENDIKC